MRVKHVCCSVGTKLFRIVIFNVNIARETFPASLHGIASSLLIETGTRYDLEALLEHILIAFESNLHMPPDKIHSRYTALLHKTGNRIRVGGKEGIFDSVDIDGYLILKTSSTTERIVSGTIELID